MTIGANTPTIDELRARVTEAGPWFVVPAGTLPDLCKGCGCLIYFVRQPSGKVMPIDVLVPHGVNPHHPASGRPPRDGRGASHFATCPAREQFRRAK